MSVKVMAWVWDQDIPRNLKFVLLAYADHADHDGKSIFPAVDTIAKKTGYHRRQVQRVTAELEQNGWMIPDGQGPKGTNKWRIDLSTRDGKMSPLPDEGVASRTYGGDISDQRGVTPMSPEPSSLTIKDSSEEENGFKIIVKEWERSVGPITGGIAQELGLMVDECKEHISKLPPGTAGTYLAGEGWVIHAIQTANKSATGKFNVRYLQAIVDRWMREGFDSAFVRPDADAYVTGIGKDYWE